MKLVETNEISIPVDRKEDILKVRKYLKYSKNNLKILDNEFLR